MSHAKIRAVSLNDEDDMKLKKIGGGSRTEAVKALMELYEVISKVEGKTFREKRYNLHHMLEDLKKIS